jgi:hemolysin activation/secretion protein
MKLLVIALLAAFAADAGAEDTLKFPIKQYRVEGNTVLPDAQVQATLTRFTGEGRDFADVQHALEALETLYRQAGFGALQVYLPEQELNQGEIVLKVVEPRLGKVRIEGNQYFGETNIRRAVPALKEGQVPNTGAVADNLRLANESPSRRLTATVQASDSPQVVDIALKVVDEKPWRAFVSADNTGSSETGRTRLSVGYQHANLFDRDQVLTAQVTTSPEKSEKVKIGGLGYKVPFYGWDDSLSVFAGYSNVESGALQGLFNVSGKGTVAGSRFTHTLPTLGAYQQKLLVGLDWRKFDTETSFLHSRFGLPGNTYIIRPVSVVYQAQSQYARLSYDWNAGLSRNLPIGDNLAKHAGRTSAVDGYWVGRFGGNVYGSLPADWAAHLGVNGQVTGDALPSGEQFGLGGASTVRGYEERELSNDSGVGINLEAYSPEWGGRFNLKDLSLHGLAFVDWGYLSRNHPAPGEHTSEQLAGAGVGVRLGLGKQASLKLDVAQALKDAGTTKKGDTKAHVSAIVSY